MGKTIELQFPDSYYSDLNVFRRIGLGDLEIDIVEDAFLVFTDEHLKELARNGSEVGLNHFLIGVAKSGARQLVENGLGGCQIIGAPSSEVIRQRVEKHKSDKSSALTDMLLEVFSRLAGGSTDSDIRGGLDTVGAYYSSFIDGLQPEARELAKQRLDIEGFGKEIEEMLITIPRPACIDEVRNAVGFKSNVREKLKDSIDMFAEANTLIGSDGLSVEALCGISGDNPALSGIALRERLGVVYQMIAFLGVNGEPKFNQVKTLNKVQSDAFHVECASFCSALVTTDQKMIKKSKHLFKAFKVKTSIVEVPPGRAKLTIATKRDVDEFYCSSQNYPNSD